MFITEKNVLRYLYFTALLIGSGIRLFLILSSNGILHPDEIYQSIEPGHFLYYGYGIRSYEFSESGSYLANYNISRSWGVPVFFAFIFFVLDHLPISYIVGLQVLRSLSIIHTLFTIHSFKILLDKLLHDTRYGYIAGIFLSFSIHYILLSTRFFYNLFFLPIVFLACAFAYEYLTSDILLSEKKQIVIIIGFGLAMYTRLDLVLFIFPFVIFHPINWKKLLNILTLTIAGWFIGGTIDFYLFQSITFLSLFSVPYNWFVFNILNGHSAIFGTTYFGWYFYRLIISEALWPFFIVFVILQLQNHKYFTSRKYIFSNLIFGWFIYENPFTNGFLFWFGKSHKEMRFIITHYFLLLAVIAILVIDISDLLLKQHITKIQINHFQLSKKRLHLFTFALLMIYVLSVPLALTIFNDTHDNLQSDSVNTALLYVNAATDPIPKGVLLCYEWYLSGGYTYLHHNIPFVSLNNRNNQTIADFIRYLNDTTFNYLIVPIEMYEILPSNFSVLLNENWQLNEIINNSTEIWIFI